MIIRRNEMEICLPNDYNIKNLGQVSTPDAIVNFMLDCISYNGPTILNKHILDSSCGNGAFLKKVVERYITAAKEKNLSPNTIKKNLETYIHGSEIEVNSYKNCVKSLNGIFPANYDIKLANAFLITDYNRKMDFVVGNPPYVKIHNLNGQYKNIISQQQLKGMVNLYLLFYLLSFQHLNNNGKLIYITPSFFKNASGKFLREKICREKKLAHIYNFKHQQVFPDITTYPVIALFTNSKTNQKFNYSVAELRNNREERVNLISTTELDWKEVVIENKFIFEQQLLLESQRIFAKKQKSYCEIKNAFATLADNIFIADKFPFTSSDIIKIIKSSTGEIKECIFPYYYNEESKRYLLKDFGELDKNTQNYLLAFQSQLKNRSIKEKDKWWQFGRSQAINDVGKNKIYVNCLFNKEVSNVNFGSVPKGMGIYGGIYILPNGIKPKIIEKNLESEKFKDFVKTFGEHRNGNWYLINSRIMTKYLNYLISLSEEREQNTERNNYNETRIE